MLHRISYFLNGNRDLRSSPQTLRRLRLRLLCKMAPRRGGGGGGGGSTSSSSCDSSSDYPCTTQLHYIYGSRVSSYYTQAELYGQLVLFIIWSIALIVLLIASLKSKARWLHAAMLSFLASFAFLCARYGLMIAESDVPIGYRFESSIVVLLQRLGMIFLFAGVFPPESSKLFKFIFWPILGTYAVLNITYLILDFIISSKGLNVFKDTWDWRLSDRDFGLTITPHGIVELTTNGDFNMSPFYVESRMYDSSSEDNFQHQRSVQIKIGVAADFLALALAVFILAVASITWIKNRRKLIRGSVSFRTLNLEKKLMR